MGAGRALCIEWEKEKTEISISIFGNKKNIPRANATPILEKYTDGVDAYDYYGRSQFWFGRCYGDVPANSFRTLSAADYVDDTVKLYETVCKAEKELSAKG